MKFIAQTAHNGLGAPAPAGICYLHVVSVQEEFLHCRPLWETSKSSEWQTVSLPSPLLTERHVKAVRAHEASALSGNTSGLDALMKQEDRPATVAGAFCGRVHCCQRRLWSQSLQSRRSWARAATFSGGFAVNWSSTARCFRAQFPALQGQVLKYLPELQTEVLLFFSLKVKQNTQNRERGIHSWLGLLTSYFWPCE